MNLTRHMTQAVNFAPNKGHIDSAAMKGATCLLPIGQRCCMLILRGVSRLRGYYRSGLLRRWQANYCSSLSFFIILMNF
jgi:hypothetical protein